MAYATHLLIYQQKEIDRKFILVIFSLNVEGSFFLIIRCLRAIF